MVLHRTRDNVSLLHDIGVVQGLEGAGGQARDGRALAVGEDGALELVVDRDVGEGQVARVGDGDGVVDRLAFLEQVTVSHVARLGDDELRVSRVDGALALVATDGLGAGAGRVYVLAGLGILDGVGDGRSGVGVAAAHDVGLRHHVLGGEGLGLIDAELGDGRAEAGLGVRDDDVGVRHVALVGHRDGVVHALTELVGLAVNWGGSLLGDLEGGVELVGVGVDLAGRGLRINLRIDRLATGGGGHVDDLAGEDVAGGDRVARLDGLGGLAGGEALDGHGREVVGVLIGDLEVHGREVAVVGDGDLVLDDVTELEGAVLARALALVGDLLGDDQVSLALVDGILALLTADGLGVLTGRRYGGVGLRVNDGVGRGRGLVGVGAGSDVVLIDYVCGGKGLALANTEGIDGLVEAGLCVGDLDVLVGHVAVVGHRDGVGHGLVELVGHLVSRLGSRLRDTERGVQVLDVLGVLTRVADGLAIGVHALGGGAVDHGAGQDVILGHDVGSREGRGLAGGQGLDGLLTEVVGLGVNDPNVLDGLVARVGHGDGVVDGLAELEGTVGGRATLLGGLHNGEGGLGRLGGIGILAGHNRDFRLVRVGARSRGRSDVDDLAGLDVSLGHDVGSLEGRGLTGSQGLDGLLAEVVAVGVGDRDAGDRQVAVVLDVDVVLDGLTELVGDTVRRVAHGGLLDRDVTVLGVGLVLGLARRDGRVAAVGLAGGGRGVHDLAGKDVGLGHGVDVLDRLGLAGSKRANLSALAIGQGRALELVLNHDVVRGQVAVVGHLDVVGDLLAQGIGAAVLGRAGGGLRNGEVSARLIDVNLVGVRVVLVLAGELDRDGVHKVAGQDVGLSDGVSRGSAHRGAGLDVLELALAQRDTGKLLERHRLNRVVDVRGLDGEGYGLAKGVGASLVRLGDDLAVIGRRRHDERAEGRRDGVVALLRSGLGALPIDGVAVLALAHVGLGAGGLELRRLAVHEASDGSSSRQRRAVIGLRRIGSGDLELSLVNGEFLGLSGVVGVVATGGTQLDGLGLADVRGLDVGRAVVPSITINAVLDLELLAVGVGRSGDTGGIGVAVVGLHHVRLRPRNLIRLDAALGHREGALALRDVVVGLLEGLARRVGDGVGDLTVASVHDGAGGLKVAHLA